MQFIRDWILGTASEAGLDAAVHEAVGGVTIDVRSPVRGTDDDLLLQVFIPFHHREGLILLRKIVETEIPNVIALNWYGVGLEAEHDRLVFKTYSGGGPFAGVEQRANAPAGRGRHFVISVGKNGCIGKGNWPAKFDESVVAIANLEQLVPTDPTNDRAFEVFVCGTSHGEIAKRDRQTCSTSIAHEFPRFVPVVLDKVAEFDPDRSLESVSGCDAFVLLVTDFLSTWMKNEYRFARRDKKPILVLARDDFFRSDYGSASLAEIDADVVTTFAGEELGSLVARWLQRIFPALQATKLRAAKQSRNRAVDRCIVERVDLGIKEKEWVRVALVQFHYDLSGTWPIELVNEQSTLRKAVASVQLARQEGADIVLLPELSGSEQILRAVTDIVDQHDLPVVIAGSFCTGSANVASIQIARNRYLVHKHHRSKFEDSPVAGSGMRRGRSLRVFQTSVGTFCVLICDDFRHDGRRMAPLVDMMFIQSYNPSPENFRTRASVLVEDHNCYVLISNAAKYGLTGVYGVLDRQYHSELERAHFRDHSSPAGEIAVIPPNEEAVLIADLCLDRTAVLVPTPVLEEYANVRNLKRVPI